MRLPSFVTVETLAKQLSWPNSVKRLVSREAGRRGLSWWDEGRHTGDAVYANVANLLSTPCGGRLLKEIVIAADPKERRSLSKAVLMEAARQLGTADPSERRGLSKGVLPDFLVAPDSRASSAETLEWDLWDSGFHDSAAWIVFDALSQCEMGANGVGGLVSAVEERGELRAKLGDYWSDWRRDPQTPAVANGLAGSAGAAALWQWKLHAVQNMLAQASLFDPALAGTLRDVADEFELLVVEHRSTLDQAREQERRRSEIVERLRAGSAQLPSGLIWHDGLLAALESDALGQAEIENLQMLADWLDRACIALATAETRVNEARTLYDTEDSDASYEILGQARKARTLERAACGTQATALLARLGAGQQTDGPAPPGDGCHTPDAAGPEAEALAGVAPGDVAGTHPGAAQAVPVVEPAPGPPPAVPHVLDQDGESSGEQPESAHGSGATLVEAANQPAILLAQAATARALCDGRYGLAAHLAHAAGALGAASAAGGGSALLRALCIGEALDEERRSQVEAQCATVFPRVLEEMEEAAPSRSRSLLGLAAALRPALFLSHSSAAEVIRKANPGKVNQDLHRLSEFIVTALPKRGGALDMAALGPVADAGTLRDGLSKARRDILDVADKAPTRTALFARASQIWQSLFRKGLVFNAVKALRDEAPGHADLVRAASAWLADPASRISELDRQVRKRNEISLEGKALDWLQASLADLGTKLNVWLAVHHKLPSVAPTHQSATQQELRALLDAARRSLADTGAVPDFETACVACRRALDGVLAMLDGQPRPQPHLTLDMLLHDDLLLFTPYPDGGRQDRWTASAAQAFIGQAGHILADPPDFRTAFGELVEHWCFGPAEHAAARLEAEGAAVQDLHDCILDARSSALHTVRGESERLRAQADDLLGADTDSRVDPAAAVHLESLAADLRGPSGEDEALSERLDLPGLRTKLDALARGLQDDIDLLIAPLERDIATLEADGHPVEHLRELVAKRDLTSLRESIAGVRSSTGTGAQADPRNEPGRLLQAFGSGFACKEFSARPLAERSTGRALEDASAGRRSVAWDYSVLSETDRDQATRLLRAWRKLLELKPSSADLRDFLLEIRLTAVKVEKETALTRARAYRVSLDPTTDRRDCPVPAFGSRANGKLNVLVADLQGLDVSELHRQVRGLEGGSMVPVLVIVKGLLPVEQRVRFMREARKGVANGSSALLDEASVLFLAARPGRSRGDMFAIALPAGAVQPYSNASSQSSPEMFFGRSDELAKLWDPDGSCLVYGGRQLGKTALLQQVRVRHHKPPAQVVIYGSLQGQADLWSWAARLLRDANVPCSGETKNTFTKAVNAWLAEDGTRRLLVLVDEADTLLSAEMENGYKALTAVRDLMQNTGRRCKFVFAGLHDVQRLARTPNSPLHHFGAPLPIGPLFGKDLEDARQMVTAPMAAAGVMFDAVSLPNRILSAVGYYPSLLQTFGSTLLGRISKADGRINVDTPLPVVVGERDVQNALDDNSFKEDIAGKFRMTLDLDERYRLITLAILHRTLDMREQGGTALPLTDVLIQQLAQSWWPQGFAENTSLDAFQGLLQEMVGLGVLVRSGNHYSIRSSRIAAMLGGKEQIGYDLLVLSERPPPLVLDTGSLRRLDGAGREPAPLTFRQESALLDWDAKSRPVLIALSSKALGLDELATSLGRLSVEVGVREYPYGNMRAFEAALDVAVRDARQARGLLAVLNGPWFGQAMVEQALAVADTRKDSRGLRVLLVPQDMDWDAADAEDAGMLWGAEILALSPLGRTGLGQWLKAHDASATPEAIERLRAWTGGFPTLLRRLPKGAARDAAKQDQATLTPDVRLDELGLGDSRLLAAACTLVEFAIEHRHAEDLQGMGIVNAPAVVRHLERIGVLERTDRLDRPLGLNPLARRLLEPR